MITYDKEPLVDSVNLQKNARIYRAEKCLNKPFSTPQGSSCNVHEVPRLPLESTWGLDKSLSKAKRRGGCFLTSSPLAKSRFVLLATFESVAPASKKQHLHAALKALPAAQRTVRAFRSLGEPSVGACLTSSKTLLWSTQTCHYAEIGVAVLGTDVNPNKLH